ncbi:MAG: phosphate acyltransferase [Chitinophagaceae bacterium]
MGNQLLRAIGSKARRDPKKLVFAEGDNISIIKAAIICFDEGIAKPILLGEPAIIEEMAAKNDIDISNLSIVNPKSEDCAAKRQAFANLFYQKRQRKGLSIYEAQKAMKDRNHFACMMVETGEADAVITGLSRNYADAIKPALQIIGKEEGIEKIAGMYLLFTKKGPLFMADTTVNFQPTATELADIAIMAAKAVQNLNITPRIAMLSYSNFGSSNAAEAKLVAEATQLVKQKAPNLIIDGEMQSHLALNNQLLKENYPFSSLVGENANVLIFPNLSAGNIAYNLMREIGGADAVGPILLGLKKPVHILQMGSDVRNIINMALIAVIDAQQKMA